MMKITEIKFRAGSDASVRAYVTDKMPTEEQIAELDMRFSRSMATGHTYSEWPVKNIRIADVGVTGVYVVDTWNEKKITVLDVYTVTEMNL